MNEIIIRRLNYMDNPQEAKFMVKQDNPCGDEMCEFEVLIDGKEVDGLLGFSLDLNVFDRDPIINIKLAALGDSSRELLKRNREDFINLMSNYAKGETI